MVGCLGSNDSFSLQHYDNACSLNTFFASPGKPILKNSWSFRFSLGHAAYIYANVSYSALPYLRRISTWLTQLWQLIRGVYLQHFCQNLKTFAPNYAICFIASTFSQKMLRFFIEDGYILQFGLRQPDRGRNKLSRGLSSAI